jgi:NADPH-dependent ferric siderophore reductase
MMTSDSPDQSLYRATALVDFPLVTEFLDPILTAIATHDMTVTGGGMLYKVASAFGSATIEPLPGQLRLGVETTERRALNRLKHALVGPLSFIAASEKLDVRWSGDETGPSLPEDLRILRVADMAQITPRMRRVVFHGDDLGRYERPDQLHCRLIFQPKDVSAPLWPQLDDSGHVVWPKAQKLATRVYTIRRIDATRGLIEIDFALHDKPGPATQWALQAAPGDIVGILGPAADGPRPADFYVLAGDETGLPGIARILEGLDRTARGVTYIEIADRSEQQSLAKPAGMDVHWLYRNAMLPRPAGLLPEALRGVSWPSDLAGAFFWGGCEHKAFREIHRLLRNDVGLPRDRQVLYSHWHRALSEEQIIEIGGEAYLP